MPHPPFALPPFLARARSLGRAQMAAWAGAFLAALTSACADPLWQQQVSALGPEQPPILAGPLHRPGQPCLLCHGAAGLAPSFVAAGTVYRDPHGDVPASGVEVVLIDARRQRYRAHSNCVGNFWVSPSEFQPVMPLWVSLRYRAGQQTWLVDMESPMHRDGDCGACHRAPKGPSSAGPVFLVEDPVRAAEVLIERCGSQSP